LAARNAAFVKSREPPHVESYGSQAVIVYEPYLDGTRHGNFLDKAYTTILRNVDWRRRLAKVHTQGARSLPRRDRRWVELDSSTSSDALLMNIFCYPGAPALLASTLGVDPEETPEFGYKARVPFANGRFDRTEVDMKLGTLLLEAKLTESDFQSKSKAVVNGYWDFAEVFFRRELPQHGDCYDCYQLIRNVLAAHASGASFCVCLDARRPDLLESWYAVMRCVRDMELRTRCKVVTWQELSEKLGPEVQLFLDLKYGIVPPGATATPLDDGEQDFR
jgi:hypothetical protein